MTISFDEQGLLEEVEALAAKRLIAHELGQIMAKEKLSKAALAKRMGTSRSQVDRLLDPDNESVTLATLAKAAAAVGQRVRVSLCSPHRSRRNESHGAQNKISLRA